MKRLFGLFLIAAVFLLGMVTVSALSETDSGILYTVTDESYITVEGFNDAGFKLEIPSYIEELPVRYIKDFAFYGNEYITTVIIPGTVFKIGKYAFSGCPNLLNVKIADGMTEIGNFAFFKCKALIGISLPGTLKTIGDSAFEGCTMLENLKIPASVEYIGYDTFMTCERLILDVSENSYAAGYAKQYLLKTDFKSSWGYDVLRICIATAILGAVVIVARIYIKKRLKKHKIHDKQ